MDVDHLLQRPLTRGQFLHGALRVGAALAVGPAVVGCARTPSKQRAEVRAIVIGAGIAGIAAADTLRRAGVDVVVLEARSRIGGRIWSAPMDGVHAELGASWVHGLRDNPLVRELERFGVRRRAVEDEWPALADAAGAIATSEVERAGARVERAMAKASARAEALDADVPLARVLDGHAAPDPVMRWIARSELQNEYGADPDVLSAWWHDESAGHGSAEELVVGRYADVVDGLARGLRIERERHVTSVEVTGSRVRVRAGERELEAEHVVVAVPLAVLAADAITFDPPLPDTVRAAASRIGTGSLEKVVLRFDDVAWLPDAPVLGATNTRDVERGIAEFHVIADHGRGATVLGLVGGAAARELVQRGPSAMRQAAIAGLSSIVGGAIPEPRAVRSSAWSRDPLARGSYSFLSTGATPDDRAALARPITPRLVLAGEATDSRSPSTVHGAMRSGRRAAAQLLEMG